MIDARFAGAPTTTRPRRDVRARGRGEGLRARDDGARDDGARDADADARAGEVTV